MLEGLIVEVGKRATDAERAAHQDAAHHRRGAGGREEAVRRRLPGDPELHAATARAPAT